MTDTPFFKLGRFVYRHRVLMLCLWGILVLSALPILPQLMTPFQTTGFVDEQSESARTDRYLDKKLGVRNNRLIVMYHSSRLSATHALYTQKIEKSLAALKHFPIKHDIFLPSMNKKQISSDQHTAYAVIVFDSQTMMTPDQLAQFKKAIKTPRHMTVRIGGEPIFIDSVNQQTETDLSRADIIAAPMAILILILIFGSLVAALIPVMLGGGCALIILMTLFGIAQVTALSIFTINIALLLGLCLSLDYSLFIISRFREELNQDQSIEHAIAMTLATAGKAVFFSGLAVFISLSALLLFPVNILFSVGVGGLTAVLIAVLIALFMLPAVLSVLKSNINKYPVRLFKESNAQNKHPNWRKLASAVIKRPLLFFFTAFIGLLLLGTPFLNARFGVSDDHILPEHSESRAFFDAYNTAFNVHELSPITLVVKSNQGPILTHQHISQLYDLSKKIQRHSSVQAVNSIVTTEPSLTKRQYQQLYQSSERFTNPAIHRLLKTTTREPFTLIDVVSQYDSNSPKTLHLIDSLRNLNPGHGLSTEITGVPVNNHNVLHRIAHLFPFALAWIVVLTYLVLLVLLRSVFLPLKAILMNALSLTATYGILVFVFQEGHLHQLLQFDPQGILDISLLVIIFCALFGFSMDYEVFLLTRIQESYKKNKDNDQSIVFGIEHSSQIITSAALIVVVTCGSFMVAEVLMVKEFGLGIAVAICVDAFIVRTIFVPATMALMKHWNWYLPKWLDKLLP